MQNTRDLSLERVDLPDVFSDPKRLERLKHILYIHDHYSARLVATATGSSVEETRNVLDQLHTLGRLRSVWAIADTRRRSSPYQILFLKTPPRFPLVYISPSSGKRIRLKEVHADVELEYERVNAEAG